MKFHIGVWGKTLEKNIMKLIDAFKNKKGAPFLIPDCSREELPEFFKQMGYTVGAEIGVYKGEFTEHFCKAGLKMFAIDPWHSYGGSGRSQKLQERQNFLYGHASRLLGKYNDCTIIRKTSMDAVDSFKDNSLDFVYIDGNHSFSHAAEDIQRWAYKVRKGGIVAGHDYYCTDPASSNVVCHVGAVIDAYVRAFGIKIGILLVDQNHWRKKSGTTDI